MKLKRNSNLKAFVRQYFIDQGKGFNSLQLEELASSSIQFQVRCFDRIGFAARKLLGRKLHTEWDSFRRPPNNHFLANAEASVRFSIAKYYFARNRLKRCLRNRRMIEHLLMCGNFKQAESQTVQFGTIEGRSLWQLEMELLVAQFSSGYHGNITSKGRIQLSCKRDWIKLVAENNSKRIQLNLSTEDYQDDLGDLGTNQDSIDNYAIDFLRYYFAGEAPTTEPSICNVVHFDSRHAVLDQYLTLLRILEAQPDSSLTSLHSQDLVTLSSAIECTSLASLVNHSLGNSSSYANLVLRTACLSLEGQFEASAETALEAILEDSTYYAPYQFAAIALARTGVSTCPKILPSESPAQLLLEHHFDWYRGSKDRRSTLEALCRFARALRCTSLGSSLAYFVNQVKSPTNLMGLMQLNPTSSPCSLPQIALYRRSNVDALTYLAQLPDVAAVEIAKKFVAAQNSPETPIPIFSLQPDIQLLYQGALHYGRKQFEEAAESLKQLRTNYPALHKLFPEALTIEAEALLKIGEHELGAQIAADAYSRNAMQILPSTLSPFSDVINSTSTAPSKSNIAWPILAMAVHKLGTTTMTVDHVHDFVGDYLEAQNVVRPTELLEANPTVSLSLLRFLVEACTPDVLECSIWYSSLEEVFKERLQLCELLHGRRLCEEDSLLREIAYLTRKLAVLDLTSIIERSRITVDTELVFGDLLESTLELFNTFLSIRAFKNNDMKRTFKLLGMPTTEGGRVVIVPLDQDIVVFEKIFKRFRQAFLYSPEHGLDANLSQRVRHGTLAGELRAPFDANYLTTKKDSSGFYRPNQHWKTDSLPGDNEDRRSLDRIFAEFSKNVDMLIHEVRDEWIQIRSEAKPRGLFDYAFTSQDIATIVEGISPLAEHDDVRSVIAEALIGRTNVCLELVRKELTSTLSSRLNSLTDELLAQLESLSIARSTLNLSAVRVAVTQCKTEMGRAIEKLANWFQLEDRLQQKNFDFKYLLDIVGEMLERLGTPCSVQGRLRGAFKEIPGRFFRPFWDLLLILFDNAAKHSGLNSAIVLVEVSLEEHESTIVFRNKFDQAALSAKLKLQVDVLNSLSLGSESELIKLRQEGGSGVAKIHKIIRHELGREKDYYVEFHVQEDEFVVRINLGKGFVVENPAD